MIKLFRDYFTNKEKMSHIVIRMEKNAEKMIDDGYSPAGNPLRETVIDLLESILKTTGDVIEEHDIPEVIESMLHIDACVSNIYEKLGLPPCSFSKIADK